MAFYDRFELFFTSFCVFITPPDFSAGSLLINRNSQLFIVSEPCRKFQVTRIFIWPPNHFAYDHFTQSPFGYDEYEPIKALKLLSFTGQHRFLCTVFSKPHSQKQCKQKRNPLTN